MKETGFSNINYRNISAATAHSSRRLYRFYFLASLYLFWKKISFSKPATALQKGNIRACKFQHTGMKRKLWEYGIISGIKS
jgi:hypothetical protein